MRIVVWFAIAGIVSAAEWDYGDHGKDMWKIHFPTCAGNRQSPIDIPASDSPHLQYEALGQITFTGYGNMAGNMVMSNNGHTATVAIANDQKTTYIQGGGLNGTYLALQFHFHWGPDNQHGSEHTFRGKMFPLELHIVHFKESYGTVTEALKNPADPAHPDGAAVIGVFFEISEEDNPKLNPIINKLASIKYQGQSASVNVSLDDILGSHSNDFYRYLGSLTTPECNEAVIWTVLEGRNYISSNQLARFRELKETAQTISKSVPLHINYRPVQLLGNRTVIKTYEDDIPHWWHWGYGHGSEGADNWPYYYATCNGDRQSPINIPPLYHKRIAAFDDGLQLDTLEFVNYDKIITGTIQNNGHSVVVIIESPDVYIHKGGLPGMFKAVQFHYHWGQDNKHGSEHTVNGMKFPLEMHIVHYNTKYHSVAEALKRDDGLAVVGFLFEVSNSDNTAYDDIIDAMNDVKFKGQSEAISGFSLQHLTLNNLRKNSSSGIHYPFYRYNGGLTTPPCSQVVIWTVINEPVHLSSAQLEHFRKLTHIAQTSAAIDDHDYITENYRPVQDLGLRNVYISSSGLVGQPGMSMPVGFKWSYHGDTGPQNWKHYYPTCEGERQSPIDIPSFDSAELMHDPTMGLDNLEFMNYDQPIRGTIKNNGHTVQVDIESPDVYIQNGGLHGKYKAVQFHFHWGTDNHHGSEHTINGAAYPLELHIVHYKESYGTVSAALKQEDGLAVVGFFFIAAPTPNEKYSDIISSLEDVKYKGAAKAIRGFNLRDITLSQLRLNASVGIHYPYYRYTGGLTTPPCSQIVTWSVMNEPIRMSAAQIAAFRSLLHVTEADSHSGNDHGEYITENYRPVQALHTRVVYTSYAREFTSGTLGLLSSMLCLSLAFVFVALFR